MRRCIGGAALTIALLVPAGTAGACTCPAPLPPREKLASARAAFIGRVVDKDLVESGGPMGDVYRYRVRVRRSLKRRLGPRIKLKSGNSGGTCGFEWRRGQRVAAYLYGGPGNWSTGLCLLERPAVMRRLADRLAREGASGTAAGAGSTAKWTCSSGRSTS